MKNTYELNNINENYEKKPLLDSEKIYSVNQKFFAELIGTTILIFVIELFGSIVYKNFKDTYSLGPLILVPITFLFGKISGAHFNPAISLAMFLRKKIIFSELVYYIGAQILGSLIGNLFVFLCIQGDLEYMYNNCEQFTKDLKIGAYFALLGFDVISTFIYVLVFFASNIKRKKYWALSGSIIGITFYVVSSFGYYVSLNPIRMFFPNIIGAIKKKGNIGIIFIDLIGPFIGAIAAGFMSILFE